MGSVVQKTVTCTGVVKKPSDYIDDPFEGRQFKFWFSIEDNVSSVPGRPKESCRVIVKIDGELLFNWGLGSRDEELAKILLYYAAEHIQRKLRDATLQKQETLYLKRVEHPESRCPVNLSEIERIKGFSFDVLIDQPQSIPPKTWEPLSDDEVLKMIAGGETNTVEFKIGACRNPYTEKKDDSMKDNIVEEVAAFMNTDGGTVLVGVSDDGEIRGVETEYVVANKGKSTWDGYELFLQDALNDRLEGIPVFQYYQISPQALQGDHVVCRIIVQPTPAPVYVNDELYIRSGNQKRKLKGAELVAYVEEHWG